MACIPGVQPYIVDTDRIQAVNCELELHSVIVIFDLAGIGKALCPLEEPDELIHGFTGGIRCVVFDPQCLVGAFVHRCQKFKGDIRRPLGLPLPIILHPFGGQIGHGHILGHPHGVGIGVIIPVLEHKPFGAAELHRPGQLAVGIVRYTCAGSGMDRQAHRPGAGCIIGQRGGGHVAVQGLAGVAQGHRNRLQARKAGFKTDIHGIGDTRLGLEAGADTAVRSDGIKTAHIHHDGAGGGPGVDGDAVVLQLLHQIIEIVQGLALKDLPGEIGLLDALELPLNGNDGPKVAQGDGHPVHIAYLAQVGVRVIQQGLDLIQGVCHPVQLDGLVGDQVSILIQKAVLLQKGLDGLAVLPGEVFQLLQQGLVLPRTVAQQVAHGRIGCAGQQRKGHAERKQQA